MKKDKKWAQKEVDRYLSYEGVNEARNALALAKGVIDQLDEPDKVVIPEFVAEAFEKTKGSNIYAGQIVSATYNSSDEVGYWLEVPSNEKLLLRAWLDGGYEIEKEKLYYAKIKGHELIDTEPILDDNTGKDVSEWNRNIYFIQQLNKKIVIDMKDSGLRGAKHFMTIKEWAELGINENNAEFEPVEVSP